MRDEGCLDVGPDVAPRDAVLARVAPRWSATRTEDNLAVTFRRLARGQRARRAGVAGALALGGLALAVAWGARDRLVSGPALASRAPEAAAAPAPRRLDLPDGSTVALADARARANVDLARSSPGQLVLELSGGPARFDIPARRARTVVVRTARVEVAILAAKFDLSPMGERVRVAVGEGEVAVTWPGAGVPVTMRAGADAIFPPPVGTTETLAPAPAPARAGALARSRFRMQVARRDYAGAYRSLVAAPGVADHSAEDLMLAADAARLSGHPAAAVPFLRRLLREHEQDVRAPVAAFTLGRVLLAELARPTEAADAFALSERLAPEGPLASDALGREVEAAARAGDAARARRVAEAYVARFPNGARVVEVRRAGGLE
jgi:transmembrane sensor